MCELGEPAATVSGSGQRSRLPGVRLGRADNQPSLEKRLQHASQPETAAADATTTPVSEEARKPCVKKVPGVLAAQAEPGQTSCRAMSRDPDHVTQNRGEGVPNRGEAAVPSEFAEAAAEKQ